MKPNSLEFHNEKGRFYKKIIKSAHELTLEKDKLINKLEMHDDKEFKHDLFAESMLAFVANCLDFPKNIYLGDYEKVVRCLVKKLENMIYYKFDDDRYKKRDEL